MSGELFDRHKALLELAVAAVASRGGFSAYPDDVANVNEVVAAEGTDAFNNYCGSYFYLDQPGSGERVGGEISAYGRLLDVQYPRADLDTILSAALRAKDNWARANVEVRAGICLEVLQQLQTRAFEIALAAMHTTGSSFDLAFRHDGAFARERGLEAVAIAYQEIGSIPREVMWEQLDGRSDERVEKTFRVAGLGVGLVIGCSTQPNWSAYPGIFANLMTGNAVVVKPNPLAVLPLAITVGVARHVLKEAGYDANLITLVVDEPQWPLAQTLAVRPEVRLIDYAGNLRFASWLVEHARNARAQLSAGSVNPVLIHGTDDLHGMLRNLALSAITFGGRICTAPRVVFTARTGIDTPAGIVDAEAFDVHLAQHFSREIGNAGPDYELLGAMRDGEFDELISDATAAGNVVFASRDLELTAFPGARVRSPVVVRLKEEQTDVYTREWFGPVLFLVECETMAEAISRALLIARDAGAQVVSLYATDAGIRNVVEEAVASTGATLCVNFTGARAPHELSPFSDFHRTGVDPAGGFSLIDSQFIVSRFRIVSTRSHIRVVASSAETDGGRQEK